MSKRKKRKRKIKKRKKSKRRKIKKRKIRKIKKNKTKSKESSGQKYNIDYKNHYGKNKSYIKLKRKVDQHQHIMNKRK